MSMFWDFGSLYQEALRRPLRQLLRQRQTVSKKTLRRPGDRLLRQRQNLNSVVSATSVFYVEK